MKYQYPSFNVFFFSFILLVLTACAPKTQKSQDIELVNLKSRDIKDLKNLYRAYHKLENIDVSVFLKQQDLSLLINHSFKDFVKEFSDTNESQFSNVSFEKMHFDISQQSLRSELKFSFEFNDNKQKLFGHIHAHHHIKVGSDEFILDTKFNEIILDKVDGSAVQNDDDKNAKLISAAVKDFVHKLNIAIINKPLSIGVDMNVLSGINENNIFEADDYSMHWVQPINLKTKMKVFVPYFSKDGLLLLGSSKEKRQEINFNNDIKKLPSILKNLIDNDLHRDMGTSLEQVQKYSSYYVSKKYIAQQMSKAFDYIDMRVINKFFMKIDEKDQNISKNIYFFDKNKLPSCEGVKIDCKEKLKDCNKHCPMKYGIQNCSSCEKINNPFEKVRCLSKVEGCRSTQEKLLYNCHKKENLCVAANTETEKICEIQNLEKFSICREKKEELVFVNDEIVLARLSMNYSIPSSYAVQRLRRISFDASLSTIEVTRNIHLSMESKISLLMQYSHYEDINCSFGIDQEQLIHSEFDHVDQKRTLPLITESLSDGSLVLSAVSKPSFRSTKLKNSPYEYLIKNRDFALRCTYQGMPMKPISAEELLEKREIPYKLNPMLAEIELPFEEEKLSFIITPVKLGSDILLFPTLEKKAIAFSRQAHFY